MKKRLLILTLASALVSVGNVFGEDDESVKFGVRAAFTLNNMGEAFNCKTEFGGRYESYEAEEKLLPSFSAGIALNIPVAGIFQIHTGLDYAIKGDRVEMEESTLGERLDYNYSEETDYKAKIRLGYVELPVQAALHLFRRSNSHLEIAAGPYFAFAVNGNTSSKEKTERELMHGKKSFGSELIKEKEREDLFNGKYMYERTEESKINGECEYTSKKDEGKDEHFEQAFKRFDLGFAFDVAYVFNHIYAGVEFDLGVLNILKDDKYVGWSEKPGLKAANRTFGLKVGYNF